jgi:hypothetical protein
MKKSKNLEQMDGKELLALYRRKVRLATNTTNESVAPSNNAHLKEVSKIRKELLKRLGTFSVLILSDEVGGSKVIGPFFNEKEKAWWLSQFWSGFKAKFGGEKVGDLQVESQKINTDWRPIHPSDLLRIVRLSGSRILL